MNGTVKGGTADSTVTAAVSHPNALDVNSESDSHVVHAGQVEDSTAAVKEIA